MNDEWSEADNERYATINLEVIIEPGCSAVKVLDKNTVKLLAQIPTNILGIYLFLFRDCC